MSEAAPAPPLAPLLTPRLRLRPFAGPDYAALRLIDGDSEVLRFRSRPEITPAATLAFLVQADHDALKPAAERRQWAFAGVRLADDALLVQIGLTRTHAGAAEGYLWYSTRRDAWGQGYAAEAGVAMLAFGFETLGFTRLVAECHPDNHASLRVMQKIGLLPEAHTPEEDARWPERVGYRRCALSREQWLARPTPEAAA